MIPPIARSFPVYWLCCTLLLGNLPLPAGAAAPVGEKADWNLETLLAALAKRPEGHARFIETRTLKVLTAPVRSSGTLYYRRPDVLEKHTLSPREEMLRVEGERVTVEDGSADSPRVLFLSEQPAIQAIIESIRAPLTGNGELLRRLFHISFGGSERSWLLSLVPREARFGEWVRAVAVRGSGDKVTQVDIQERNGDTSVLRIEPRP